jgi:mannose-1-phosphate guanylyltransferase
MQRTALIMAGGSGERFWPLSRQQRPKQLLKLTSQDKTMLDEAIERITPLMAAEHIFIVTSELLQASIRESLRDVLPPENVIAEPLKRNTSPCIALGAAFIAERYAHLEPSNISIAVLTADHFIEKPDIFRASVDAAFGHAERTGELVTFGVRPTRPATGYGYIEVSMPAASSAHAGSKKKNATSKSQTHHTASASSSLEARRVLRFREKPNVETAQEFIEQGNYFWNSGMFFWRADSVITGLQEHLPEVGIRIDDMREALRGTTTKAHKGAPPRTLAVFEHLPDISIDYGLMERAKNVSCVCVDFGWDDVGSWDALERVYEADSAGNINVGGASLLDCNDCIVLNSAGSDAIAVAAIGVEHLVIVTTPDGILVCPKDRVQDVRKAVAALRERGGGKFV